MVLSVFLVEESVPMRVRLRRIVDALDGVRVVGEAGRLDGLAPAVAAACADVVVLDLRLPGGFGLEVVASLLGIPRRPVVLVVGALKGRAYRHRALAAGVAAYFDKARELDALAAHLQRLAPRERPAGSTHEC